MKDLVDSKANDSVVIRETSSWLTNFISQRTRDTYKKTIEEFAPFAELETPDDLYDVDSSTVLAWREHLIGLGLLAAVSEYLAMSGRSNV